MRNCASRREIDSKTTTPISTHSKKFDSPITGSFMVGALLLNHSVPLIMQTHVNARLPTSILARDSYRVLLDTAAVFYDDFCPIRHR